MAKYDLTGSLEKDFTFSIDDQNYTMRKPTVREMRELVKKFAAVDKEADVEKQGELSEEALKGIFVFITPTEGSRPIGEVLDEQPAEVQVAFNNMIAAELGANK
jgi:hypothetical protein